MANTDQLDCRKTVQQNRLFHAQVADIARQVRFAGRLWREESWKRLLVECWVNVERNEARANGWPDPFPELVMLVPGLDGETIVQLGAQVRHLTKEQMAGLIESTFAFAAEHDVVWSSRSLTNERESA